MVGRIVSKLEEANIRDNTLMVFIGDNGTLGRVTSRFQGTDFQAAKADDRSRHACPVHRELAGTDEVGGCQP